MCCSLFVVGGLLCDVCCNFGIGFSVLSVGCGLLLVVHAYIVGVVRCALCVVRCVMFVVRCCCVLYVAWCCCVLLYTCCLL